MNALVLWVPGTLLFLTGLVLLLAGTVSFGVAVAFIAVGTALESAGMLLWIRQRQASRK